MKNKSKIKKLVYLITLMVVIGAVVWTTSNRNPKNDLQSENTINVLVSIPPQLEFVKKVGGDKIKVGELIHPGESPATYSLTARDLVAIEEADIYFRIGYVPFEKANVDKISDTNPDLKIVQMTDEVNLRYFGASEEHSHEGEDEHEGENHEHEDEGDEHEDEGHEHEENEIDPHLWLSIENVMAHVDSIAAELALLDPTNESFYKQNANNYKNELAQLQVDVSEQLSKVEQKHLLVFHPAWGYLSDEFGFEQIAIEYEGNEPTAEQLTNILAEAKEQEIGVIFVQKQFSTVAAKSIAEELKIPVVQIDPLDKNYAQNMKSIAKTISENL